MKLYLYLAFGLKICWQWQLMKVLHLQTLYATEIFMHNGTLSMPPTLHHRWGRVKHPQGGIKLAATEAQTTAELDAFMSEEDARRVNEWGLNQENVMANKTCRQNF